MSPRMPSWTWRALFVGGLFLASAGCPAPAGPGGPEPEDVDLGTLKITLWQPAALASGEGDLLDDAKDVQVTLLVDGKERTLTLDDGLKADVDEAAPSGSEVAATVRTSGTALPDALARTGRVQLEPGSGDVTVTAVLAPPDVPHALSPTLPNARTGMAVCASEDGRVWAMGGLLGTTFMADGSVVLDAAAREVRLGPGLAAKRAFASCVADDEGGVYVAGGCDVDQTPVSTLSYSATGESGSAFVEQRSLSNAGCHTRLARTSEGTLVVLAGTQLQLVPSDGSAPTFVSLPGPRFGALLTAFPEGEHVLVSGGFSDPEQTNPVSGSLLYDLDDGGGPVQLSARFSAAVREGDALIVVDETQLSRLSPDGALEPLLPFALPGGGAPLQVAPLYDGRYALLAPNQSAVRIIGDGSPRTISLPAPREHLLSEPGGALFLLGGDTPGVSVIVVE